MLLLVYSLLLLFGRTSSSPLTTPNLPHRSHPTRTEHVHNPRLLLYLPVSSRHTLPIFTHSHRPTGSHSSPITSLPFNGSATFSISALSPKSE
ncbi:hypothetical protein JAAARDRAFT_37571 [Jaapia argillacea MUCL 33604]|uniref:Secreted protein n=1 Tax=Jaapia argillacea MUCL 33604 TaxID=933084 RepID=A0A067PXG5_9AGAM|nr:hypothetical protein JAAARDRAFT_37571 [Jaapia argillacea MUCL 33604]